MYYDALERTRTRSSVTLIGPGNTFVAINDSDSESDLGSFTLTEAGTYYLFVEGNQATGTPDYSFRLLDGRGHTRAVRWTGRR